MADNTAENTQENNQGNGNLQRLTYASKNIWAEIDQKQKDEVFKYAEGYKEFLDRCRTERLTVRWTIDTLEKQGFKPFAGTDSIKPGDRLFALNREKNIVLITVGSEGISQGMRFLVAHADVPRLDLKQIPLYEDTEIALLKTHYYGGIKKYHWLNIPLALVGVVVTEEKKIELSLGLKPHEPVFVIPDLLPHLSRKLQDEKKAKEFIEAENLNLLVGTIPVADKEAKERVKLAVLEKLNREYGMVEEDFVSAELQAVPATQIRDVGFDHSMIGGYGHDDRVSTYAALTAHMDAEKPGRTAVTFIVDKEEIGSDGPTSARSLYIYNLMGRLIEKMTGQCRDCDLRDVMEQSVCLSADVSAAINPMYKSVHDERNAARLSHGLVLTKFTGHGGKYAANDADAELVGDIRRLFNRNGIFWQYGSTGKVDQGGGGTIAKHFAFYNTSVIDCGVPVIGMHSPYEIVSKADVYYSYLGFKAFLEKL
jgi:aspartyl aminopeptidase